MEMMHAREKIERIERERRKEERVRKREREQTGRRKTREQKSFPFLSREGGKNWVSKRTKGYQKR